DYLKPNFSDSGLRNAIGEWKVGQPEHKVISNMYNTKWGLPSASPNSYWQNVLYIPLSRSSQWSYLRLLLPLFVPALFALTVFLLWFDSLTPAVSVWSTIFFAIVAEHHAFYTTMPDLNYFLQANWYYIVTYSYMAVLLLAMFKVGVPIAPKDSG